ncbi:hypothetical protein BKA82DRAFT_725179 [Pisolithus tinctorius]|uniref:Uncharacterized protein n=1 Tax=Pisolithus tinctorius Marx 270 TaxID=870435 RepID=A0A0C3IY84_PISTI|nr:hypothetical protein BKA82DRAFT_725179 [Pisolithus tinctorius]KIO01773.1 hypothetical protein M404DRAFT_725179 [Pisolithus tinctorius Marx 270]
MPMTLTSQSPTIIATFQSTTCGQKASSDSLALHQFLGMFENTSEICILRPPLPPSFTPCSNPFLTSCRPQGSTGRFPEVTSADDCPFVVVIFPPSFRTTQSILVCVNEHAPHCFFFLIVNLLTRNVERLDNTSLSEPTSPTGLSPRPRTLWRSTRRLWPCHQTITSTGMHRIIVSQQLLSPHGRLSAGCKPLSADFVVFSSSHPWATPVEVPSSNVAESGALSIAPIPVPQDPGAWSNQYTQASYSVSTSSTVHPENDRRSSIVSQLRYSEAYAIMQTGGQRVQLLHGVPVPITQADTPSRSHYPGTPLVNALTPCYDEVAQGRASDHIAYPCIALSSPNTSTMLPHTVGNQYPLGHPQDNRNVSTFGEPSFVHHTTAGPAVGLASAVHGYPSPHCGWADHYGSGHDSTSSPSPNVSSLSAPANSVVFPLQELHISDRLDRGRFPTPLERAASPAWSTSQPYRRPNEPTEMSHSPVVLPTHSVTFDRPCTHLPHTLPYTLPTPSQSNSNAQMVDLHASASAPPSPSPLLPSPGEVYTRNLKQPKESRARGRTRAHHRTKIERSLRASRLHRYRDLQMCCGWRNEDDRPCGAPVTHNDCADHFAAVHGIIDMARDIKVPCRWCPSSAGKKVIRKNILRHIREKHLRCPRLTQYDS